MYVKIEKDNSGAYLLIEGKKVEFKKNPVQLNMSWVEYINKLLINFLDKEPKVYKQEVEEMCNYVFGKNFPISLTEAVTVQNINDIKNGDNIDANVFIKGIIVDGIPYLTCGNIYILNDNGQTIQKV